MASTTTESYSTSRTTSRTRTTSDSYTSTPKSSSSSSSIFSISSPSSVPATIPPQSTPVSTFTNVVAQPTINRSSANTTPKIGGSEGGFIALVTILSLIIIGACIAVFYLLKTRKRDHRRRAAERAAMNHRYQPAGSNVSRAFPGGGILSKFLPRRGTMSPSSALHEDDTWDARDELWSDGSTVAREYKAAEQARSSTSRGGMSVIGGWHESKGSTSMHTGESSRMTSLSMQAPVLGYDDPFTPPYEVPRSTSPEAMMYDSPVHVHPPAHAQGIGERSLSGNGDRARESRHATQESARTFSGGTKFLEDI